MTNHGRLEKRECRANCKYNPASTPQKDYVCVRCGQTYMEPRSNKPETSTLDPQSPIEVNQGNEVLKSSRVEPSLKTHKPFSEQRFPINPPLCRQFKKSQPRIETPRLLKLTVNSWHLMPAPHERCCSSAKPEARSPKPSFQPK